MSKELKPCPFCGSQAQIRSMDEYYYAVECQKLCGGTRFVKNKEKAIEIWNKRAIV